MLVHHPALPLLLSTGVLVNCLQGSANRERSTGRRSGVGCRKARAETLIKKQGRQEATERERIN